MVENDKIYIRKTNLDDIHEIIALEKENYQFVKQYDITQHSKIIEDEYHLSIFEKQNNLLVGYIILVGVSGSDRIIEFRRIVISKKGLGYGKNSIKLIKKICFENYKANKIWLDVYADNIRAIKLYQSQGFLKETQINIRKEGTKRDIWIMSISNN